MAVPMDSLFSVNMRIGIEKEGKFYLCETENNPSPKKYNTKMQGQSNSKGGIQQRKLKTHDHTKICTRMFLAA